MNIRKVSRTSIQLESFAMTDVVLNLFIFFVITFSLLYTFSEKLTDVDLPLASPQEKKITGILISITENHKIFLNEREVTTIDKQDTDLHKDIDELTEELQRVLGDVSEDEETYYVVIRADKSLPYREVQKALNSVLKSGVSMVHFAVFEEQR
jgi:biopolymer transport protein ExbD